MYLLSMYLKSQNVLQFRMERVAYKVDTLISKLSLHISLYCNGEISLQGALCRSMPDHLEQDMAIILLMICYLCYVQFCLQVYDEAKGMLIIVLLVESENMDIVLLHKCTMSIATVNIAFTKKCHWELLLFI